MKFITAQEAYSARDDLTGAIQVFLVSRGWTYTSDTFDSCWRYRRTVNGGTLLCDQETALKFEDHQDVEACVCAETSTRNCPVHQNS